MTLTSKFCLSRYRWMLKYASWRSKFFVLSARLLLWGCLAQLWQLWWEESRPVSLSWITPSCCVQAVLLLPLLLALFLVSIKVKCLAALSSLVHVSHFRRNPILWYILYCFVGTPCSVNLHVVCYCVVCFLVWFIVFGLFVFISLFLLVFSSLWLLVFIFISFISI